MSTVRFENINKFYGENQILNDINMSVNEGEFLVLVGPSGCGKSTTLRMVAGLETATTGNIYIDDKVVNDVEPSNRDVAMVFQNYALYPHMSVLENMAFGLKIRKFDSDEIQKRVKEASEILQITDLLERRPKELSGGQRQRVALGRCIVRNPKVFLFDEPLSNLDAKLRAEMRIEIKKLHQVLKTTMIYVTHDQTEAMTMGDRIAVMNNGVIEQLDIPVNIYNNPRNQFVAGFIGMPQMNLISGKLSNNADGKIFKNDELEIPLTNSLVECNGKELILGIRPEDVIISIDDDFENNSFNARVDVIEPLGSVSLIHLSTSDFHFTCSTELVEEIVTGSKVNVKFDMNKAHFFDHSQNKISFY